MKKDSYPNQVKNELAEAPQYVAETITQLDSLKELAKMGRPKTAAELQTRLDSYFNFCKKNALKPGIESMSLALNIDRRTFWTWCNGSRGEEYQEVCIRARQVLTSFLETSMYCGKINPAAAIFSLKNIAGWTDTMQIETNVTNENKLTAAELPIFDNMSDELLPTFENSAEEIEIKRSDIPTFESEV